MTLRQHFALALTAGLIAGAALTPVVLSASGESTAGAATARR